ncbi:MAG: radical SAM family heme chaperone HemW [Planctomycetes bacterium]|nr:radical SAM family heme chaperone HemW [Planctomycetota bacterium]MCB9888146.1 radical SAM family heme chaperone HemW [Planctomycetota bacterium]
MTPDAVAEWPADPDPTATSVYVHVPFCVVKCGYCDFNSFTPEQAARQTGAPSADPGSALDRFLDALHIELDLVPLPPGACSVFFGGGTPTFLDPDRLRRLFAITGRRLDLRGRSEVTMEANPESVTPEKAQLMRDAGVNRVSLGAQSFDDRYLRFLDRAHDAERTRTAFRVLRDAGFRNISLDLMFSIPGQTMAEWESDLRAALELEPDHLSCYNLTYELGTRLTRDRQQGRVTANSDELDRAMFERTREILAAAGFTAYETSNFAGGGGPCRHNDHYWLQGNYLGLGPGASDHRDGVRSTNLKPLGAWADSLERGLRPTASAETLTLRQRAAEALWLGLRRTAGVDTAAIAERLGFDIDREFAPAVAKLIGQDLVERRGSRLLLTPFGQLFGNTVGEEFLGT